mgnify:FL=1
MIIKKLIAKLKPLVPKKLKPFLLLMPPFNYSTPYINSIPKFEQFNVSDYFLFRRDEYETVFIAENNLALTLASPVECKHVFYFFDAHGVLCGSHKIVDSGYHLRLNIDNSMVGDIKIGGFIHQTWYKKLFTDELNSVSQRPLIFQHRGYTGFRKKNNPSSVFSFLHGNFGALYIDKHAKRSSLARLATVHNYTPQYILKPTSMYEFYFLNPVNKDMEIIIELKDDRSNIIHKHATTIKAFSHYRFEISGSPIDGECNITWKSSLPICRAIVFEATGNRFDVFHS